MSKSVLTYDVYNKRSFIVHGDREKYGEIMKTVSGRWNNKLKPEPGWTVPRDKEDELKQLIKKLSGNGDSEHEEESTIDIIKEHTKSRKGQHKYHRAVSVSESSESDASTEVEQKTEVEPDKKNDLTSRQSKAKNNIKSSQSSSEESTEPSDKSNVEPSDKSNIESNTVDKHIQEQREKSRQEFEREKREYAESLQQPPDRPTRKRRNKPEKSESSSDSSALEESPESESSSDSPEPVKVHKKRGHRKSSRKHPHKERKKSVRRNKRESGKGDKRGSTRDPLEYYKTFSSKPSKFRELYQSEEDSGSFSSSSDYSESSSDDFPSPNSPRKKTRHEHDDYKQMYDKVQTLQRKLYEMELRNQKKTGKKKGR